MHEIVSTSQFKKDLRNAIKRGLDIKLLNDIVEALAANKKLPDKNKDHSLSGNLKKYRECHIAPDWLLIYKIEADILVLTLSRTGTHSDLL